MFYKVTLTLVFVKQGLTEISDSCKYCVDPKEIRQDSDDVNWVFLKKLHTIMSQSLIQYITIKDIINVNTATYFNVTKTRLLLKIPTKKVVCKIRKDRTANFWDGAYIMQLLLCKFFFNSSKGQIKLAAKRKDMRSDRAGVDKYCKSINLLKAVRRVLTEFLV